MKKIKRKEVRFTVSEEDYETLRGFAVRGYPGETFGTVMRLLQRDGLRFQAYFGGALERVMLIGVGNAPAQDDIQSLAKCVLEQMKGK